MKAFWKKICRIFGIKAYIMSHGPKKVKAVTKKKKSSSWKDSILYKFFSNDTDTNLISDRAAKILANKANVEFTKSSSSVRKITVTGKDGKKYVFKRLESK